MTYLFGHFSDLWLFSSGMSSVHVVVEVVVSAKIAVHLLLYVCAVLEG